MHLTTCLVAVSALLLLLLASGYTLAQSASPPAPGSSVLRVDNPAVVSTASSAPAAFPLSEKGTWDLSVWAREAIGKSAYGNFGDAFVSMAGFRTGYVVAGPAGRGRLRGTLEYFFDVIPVFVLTKPEGHLRGRLFSGRPTVEFRKQPLPPLPGGECGWNCKHPRRAARQYLKSELHS